MNTAEITKKKDIYLELDQELALRILTEEDITLNYINWLNYPQVMELTEQNNKTHDLSSVQNFVKGCFLNHGIYLFGIFYNKTHIGNIKLGPINHDHGTADVSYVIGEQDFWGKGIATLAIEAVTSFGFKSLGLYKIKAGTYENNFGSIKALQKCGFQQEGLFIEEIYFGGNRINSLRFGLIKPMNKKND
jgi:[ribosomal protein S5]-alanine N-acetyltransferase